MAEDPDHGEITSDSWVQGDLPCMSCGYNLRGCRRAGVCPECGETVWRTLPLSGGYEVLRRDPASAGQGLGGRVLALWLGGCLGLVFVGMLIPGAAIGLSEALLVIAGGSVLLGGLWAVHRYRYRRSIERGVVILGEDRLITRWPGEPEQTVWLDQVQRIAPTTAGTAMEVVAWSSGNGALSQLLHPSHPVRIYLPHDLQGLNRVIARLTKGDEASGGTPTREGDIQHG